MTEGTALIVGVGPGLGLALARAFAAEGHQVALFGRDIERLTALSAEVATPDGTARAYQADVADADALQAALRAAAHDLGAPSVLVYNAAQLVQDTPTGLDAEQLARAFAVNVTGAVVAARTVLPLLDGGRGPCSSPAAPWPCVRRRSTPPCPSARRRCARTSRRCTRSSGAARSR